MASDKATLQRPTHEWTMAVQANPSAPKRAALATCQRRSRLKSELRAKSSIPGTAIRFGMALNHPIRVLERAPASLSTVGIQKLTAYMPITSPSIKRHKRQRRPSARMARKGKLSLDASSPRCYVRETPF